MSRAILVTLLLSSAVASAQQMPVEFLDMLASSVTKLTPEQATQVAGLYNMTEMIRLGGDSVDHVLKAAIEAAAGGSIDFANVTNQAIQDSDIVKEYACWIPYIDAKSGLFWGYRVNINTIQNAPHAVAFPAVKRFIGSALARPDGSVLLVATNDQDTVSHCIFDLFQSDLVKSV